MTQVIKVSKAGIDVGTATDPNDFIFDSQYNTFKIIAEGTYSPTLGTNSSEAFATVAHGQSSVPFVFGFCKFENNRVGVIGDKASDVNFWSTNMTVDGTNIEFGYLNQTGGNYSPTFKYVICEPPL